MMKFQKATLLILPCALGLSAWAGYGLRANAEGGPTVTPLFYAGSLEASGRPATGMYSIVLTLHDAETAGQQLCASESVPTPVENGRFRVVVSAECIAVLRARPDVWTGVKFTGEDGVPHELPARAKIGAVPYSLEATHALSASRAEGTLADQVVPSGAVMAFDRDTCPAGWSELATARGRTIVGSNPTAGGGVSARVRGAAFGAESLGLAANNLPPHRHGGTTSNATFAAAGDLALDATVDAEGSSFCGGRAIQPTSAVRPFTSACALGTSGEHTHRFSTDDGPGVAQPISVMQPSLALLYCRKN